MHAFPQVSFYTEELDDADRYWLWLGIPLGYLLLSCCCCCFLCCCSCALGAPDDGRGGRPLDAQELADLAGAMPDDDVDDLPDDVPDRVPRLPPGFARQQTERGGRSKRGGRSRTSMDDEIVPA